MKHQLPSGEKIRLRQLRHDEEIPAVAFQRLGETGPLLPIQDGTVGDKPGMYGSQRQFWVPVIQ